MKELKMELREITAKKLLLAGSELEISEVKQEEAELLSILEKHAELFSVSFLAGTLNVNPVELELNVPADELKPSVCRLKPLSHHELTIIKTWIKDALAKNVIEESNSVWRSTIFPVSKPDVVKDGQTVKQYRIVTPFFALNKLLNLRATPLPSIDDVRNAVAGSTFYTTLDLRESFFQIPLHKDSRALTAFGATGGYTSIV